MLCMHGLQFVKLVENARGDHMEEAYSRVGLMTALYVVMSVSFWLSHAVDVSAFIICKSVCVRVLRCCECEFLVRCHG